MLAANPQTAYISEPLNVLHRPGVLRIRVPHWYTYICADNETDYLESFSELITYRYHLLAEIASLRSLKDFFRMNRDLGIFMSGHLFGKRLLLKDPFAVFSLDWFAERLECQIVVTVRHPAGFASSLKRLNWSFDFRDLLNQPLLMRDALEPYREEMQSIRPDDVVGQAALLWVLIYHNVHAARQRNPALRVVRHEDLSRDPVTGFRTLYAEMGLDFTPRVERAILNSSSSENPVELSREKVHSVNLDSRANLDNWKRRLSSGEIARIRQATEAVAQLYYPDVEWN
jgi:hypothetical protein